MMRMTSKNTYDKKTEKNYDYWQNQFDGHGGYMLVGSGNEFDTIRKLLLHFVNKGESFLDVGCACGNNLEVSEGMNLFLEYTGTDYAEKFIKANKERRPDINWDTMDARDLNKFSDISFDTVCLYDVIDNLDGWQTALDEACRVCSKRVILLMWMDNNMDEKRDYLRNKGLSVLDITIDGSVHFHRMMIGTKI